MTLFKPFSFAAIFLATALAGTACAAQSENPAARSELNSELFYQLLIGEISAQNGDAASGYALMLDAARKTNAPRLYERAVELALTARSGESALVAAQAWARAYPASQDAGRYVLQILIGLNKIAETQDAIKRQLAALAPPEQAIAINQLPRYFARLADKKQATAVVEQALAGELTVATTGAQAWSAIGSMRLMNNDRDGALQAARRGAALNAKADEPVLLALALMDLKTAEAEPIVLGYLQGNAPAPALRMAYARRLLDAQRFAPAYAQMLTLTAQAPEFADGWLVRGSLEFQDKKLPDAATSLQKYVSLGATAPDAQARDQERGLVQAYLLLSQISEQGGKLDEAQAYLKRIDSPQDALRVQTRRANILAQQGKMVEARALLQATPELQAEDARLKITAEAQLLRDNKQYAAAYEVLAQAIQRFPAEPDLQYDQAMVAEKLGKTAEMELLLRQVIAAKPDYHHAYNALGYSLADRNVQLAEARALVVKALSFAPNDPYILDSLGWVEFRSGNLDEALRILRGAYQARPDAEISAHLGEVLWTMNRKDEARTTWKEGMALNPSNETLLETQKRLNKP